MTEAPEGAAALPLSLTWTPDERLAEALRALLGQVERSQGVGPETPFAQALAQIVGWLSSHPSAVAGPVEMRLDREDNRLVGDIRWAPTGNGSPPPPVPAAGDQDLEIACDVQTDTVHCRVSCLCES